MSGGDKTMDIKLVSNKYIIFTSNKEEILDGNRIKEYVHNILKQNSITNWGKIIIDMFSCRKENLYLAYPEESIDIRFASYAFPYISEYFTD